MKSLNGTFVNGRRLGTEPVALQDGDLLLFAGGQGIAPGKSLLESPKVNIDVNSIEQQGKAALHKALMDFVDDARAGPVIALQFTLVDAADEEPEIILPDGSKQQYIFKQQPAAAEASVSASSTTTGQKRVREEAQQQQPAPAATTVTAAEIEQDGAGSKKQKLEQTSQESAAADPTSEIKALMEQLEREKAELARQRQQLEQMQQQQQQQQQQQSSDTTVSQQTQAQSSASSSQQAPPVEIQEEFKCAICADLILNATTLQCSHTFCKDCIMEWIKTKKICPSCRKPVSRKPMKNHTLENIIDKLVLSLPPLEQEDRRKRKQEILDSESKELDGLRKMIEKARTTGFKFLTIRDTWSDKDRQTFLQGVGKYNGAARHEYCKLTGLTYAFIDNARYDELKNACQNLNVELVQQIKNGRPMTDFESTRDRLRDFLDGDVPL